MCSGLLETGTRYGGCGGSSGGLGRVVLGCVESDI